MNTPYTLSIIIQSLLFEISFRLEYHIKNSIKPKTSIKESKVHRGLGLKVSGDKSLPECPQTVKARGKVINQTKTRKLNTPLTKYFKSFISFICIQPFL